MIPIIREKPEKYGVFGTSTFMRCVLYLSLFQIVASHLRCCWAVAGKGDFIEAYNCQVNKYLYHNWMQHQHKLLLNFV